MGGKIQILWKDPYVFEVVGVSNQTVMRSFVLESTWTLVSFIYAKCNKLECRNLQESLMAIRTMNHPWLLMGDFNSIREDRERLGGCPRSRKTMDEFNDCIDACGHVELNYHGNHLSDRLA